MGKRGYEAVREQGMPGNVKSMPLSGGVWLFGSALVMFSVLRRQNWLSRH